MGPYNNLLGTGEGEFSSSIGDNYLGGGPSGVGFTLLRDLSPHTSLSSFNTHKTSTTMTANGTNTTQGVLSK